MGVAWKESTSGGLRHPQYSEGGGAHAAAATAAAATAAATAAGVCVCGGLLAARVWPTLKPCVVSKTTVFVRVVGGLLVSPGSRQGVWPLKEVVCSDVV